MDMEFKEASTPTLTLDPFKESEKVNPVKAAEPEAMDDNVLSPEEQKIVDDFAQQIDLEDSATILQYGAGTQKKMADFSETALEKVKSKDLGEVGDLLTGVVTELKGFDTTEEKGLFGFFKKGKNKIEALKARYAKVETNVESICKVLENHQVQLLKDIAVLDKMYDANLTYFKELTMYILAGKKKLAQINAGQLAEMTQKAKVSGLPEDVQAAKDLESKCQRFEKKLYDLELTRTISIQTAPQIRMVQGNDTMMVEKIQSTLVNTIPLWKSQMVLALGVAHSGEAVKAQREVTDMTNELLRKNAETLKMATVDTARETERGIVDIETLQHTNETLISTLDEVMTIQQEGRQKRAEAETELRKMENEEAAKGKSFTFFDMSSAERIAKVGVPSMLQQSIVSISMMLMQGLVNSYGKVFVAGYTAATKIDTLAMMPNMNFSNAMSSYAAQNIGARKMDRVKQGYKASMFMVVVFSLIITSIIFLFGPQLLGLFLKQGAEGSAMSYGLSYMKTVSVFYILMGALFVSNGLLRGAGDMGAFMLSSVVNLFSRVAIAYLLAHFIGASAIWWSIPTGWAVGALFSFLRVRSGKWMARRLVD